MHFHDRMMSSPLSKGVAVISVRDAHALLFFCLALALIVRPGAQQVEASAPNLPHSVIQSTPTLATTRGKINGKIAFINNRQSNGFNILTVNPDGSSPTRLTDGKRRGANLPPYVPVYDDTPAWSPDGSKIAFVSNRNFNFSLYTMNADDSDVRQVVDSVIDCRYPAWSPDGTKIAFSGGARGTVAIVGASPTIDLYVVNADGSNLTKLTNNQSVSDSASWSPDGAQIVFFSTRDGRDKIYVMNANGSNQHAIADRGTQPSWSPDGSKVLFVGGQGDATRCDNLDCKQLYVVNPDGSNVTQLTHYAASYWTPKWSPDGAKIVFARNLATVTVVNDPFFGGRGIIERGYAIFVMNADGSNQTNISNRETGPGVVDASPDWQPLLASSSQPPPSVLGFSTSAFSVYEDAGSIQLTVTRTGNLNEAVSCDYATEIEDGAVRVRRNYTLAFGTLRFAPGETSKTISVPIINHSYEGSVLFIRLFNNQGNATFIGGNKEAAVAILNRNAAPPSTNPIDDARTFVRMQYLDFLNREPDQAGWNYWTSQITKCGTDAKCINAQRVAVSAAFFVEQEFQETGYFIYRFNALNSNTTTSNFQNFMREVQQIESGAPEQLEANKTAFIQQYFDDDRIAASFGRTNAEYVDLLFQYAQLTPMQSERDALVNALNAGTLSRPSVFRQVLDDERFKQKFYNGAFVLMQYYGYLRREPDDAGYQFWVNVLNNRDVNNYRGMVCAFLTSAEYQGRFSPVITRSDQQCAP